MTPKTKTRFRAIAIIILLLAFLFASFLMVSKIKETQVKYKGLEDKYNRLSDSVKTLNTIVNDSIYPTLERHQSYLCNAEQNSNNQRTEIMSYLQTHYGKIDKKVELIRKVQGSFVGKLDNFNNEIKSVKNKFDTLDSKVSRPIIPSPIVATAPTVTNVPVADKAKEKVTTKEENKNTVGKGGMRRLRFNWLLPKTNKKS